MDVTKPYEFIWFGAMDVTKPYELIGFGAMDSDPGRNRPKTSDSIRKMTIRTLPRDPPGEGGAKNKIKNHSKHSQDYGRATSYQVRGRPDH